MHPRDALKEAIKAIDEADRLADIAIRRVEDFDKPEANVARVLSLIREIRAHLGLALARLKNN